MGTIVQSLGISKYLYLKKNKKLNRLKKLCFTRTLNIYTNIIFSLYTSTSLFSY